MKSLFTWTERRLLRLFRKLLNRQNLHLKAEMFSFHSKYFVYRELKRAPQKLSFCFKCPDTGTVRILGNILYGSHVSKHTTDWIHGHERTNLPTLAYKTVNKENNTYLLSNEDVLEIYNRLPRASHITVCFQREGECVTHFWPRGRVMLQREGEGNVSSTVSEKFWRKRKSKICAAQCTKSPSCN